LSIKLTSPADWHCQFWQDHRATVAGNYEATRKRRAALLEGFGLKLPRPWGCRIDAARGADLNVPEFRVIGGLRPGSLDDADEAARALYSSCV